MPKCQLKIQKLHNGTNFMYASDRNLIPSKCQKNTSDSVFVKLEGCVTLFLSCFFQWERPNIFDGRKGTVRCGRSGHRYQQCGNCPRQKAHGHQRRNDYENIPSELVCPLLGKCCRQRKQCGFTSSGSVAKARQKVNHDCLVSAGTKTVDESPWKTTTTFLLFENFLFRLQNASCQVWWRATVAILWL